MAGNQRSVNGRRNQWPAALRAACVSRTFVSKDSDCYNRLRKAGGWSLSSVGWDLSASRPIPRDDMSPLMRTSDLRATLSAAHGVGQRIFRLRAPVWRRARLLSLLSSSRCESYKQHSPRSLPLDATHRFETRCSCILLRPNGTRFLRKSWTLTIPRMYAVNTQIAGIVVRRASLRWHSAEAWSRER